MNVRTFHCFVVKDKSFNLRVVIICHFQVWDLRSNSVSLKLKGHTDSVTGLSLSSDGSYLLSNSMDNTLRIWDVRPYAPPERCVKILSGHQHNFEKVYISKV